LPRPRRSLPLRLLSRIPPHLAGIWTAADVPPRPRRRHSSATSPANPPPPIEPR
jgi:hypothetical protein